MFSFQILSSPRADYYGTSVTLGGSVVDLHFDGRKVPRVGGLVRIVRSPQNTRRWSHFKTLRTGSDGWYRFTVVRTTPYDYAMQYWERNLWLPIQPLACEGGCPIVRRKPLFDSIRSGVPGTKTVHAQGRIYPAAVSRYAVQLQVYLSERRVWRSIGVGYVGKGSTAVSVSARVGRSTFRYRLYAPFSNPPPYAAGTSGVRSLQHPG